jgi:2-keto-4-pentenoate hydratase/2-oxohepta-3-ene-1,7-dioic acid hydratase in catechol pathway
MSWYGLASYGTREERHPAIVFDSGIFDMAASFRALQGVDNAVPAWIEGGIDAVIAEWSRHGDGVQAFADAAGALAADDALGAAAISPDQLLAPLQPRRIFGAAANYVEHADEMGTVLAAKADSNPYIFIKAETSAIGPSAAVQIPPQSSQVDWEVELGVVIGRTARRIGQAEALDYVAGYTVVNDVTARDMNVRDDFPFKFDWFQGKSFDTFAPIGPWIVPTDCIEDPQDLNLSLSVNGEMMQDANTSGMIFTVVEQISYLSNILTLLPGDVIATGTPTGVGMGRGIFLKPGDVMVASVENIGELENPVIAQPA